jgi:hypothetical protein
MEGGTEPYNLCRWTYFILHGKNEKKVTLITAYHPETTVAVHPRSPGMAMVLNRERV